jgi:sugar phosphate isomerase/epimerase
MQNIKKGIQLYSVREALKENFEKTLSSLADMNIQGIEFAFFYGGMEPLELAKLLKNLNLETCGIYEAVKNLCDVNHKVYDYAEALNCKYLTMGFSPQELKDDFTACLENAKIICAIGKTKNLTVCYHAHSHEFEKINGEYYLDIILKEVPDIAFEADTAWIKAGGENIVSYMQKHADRIPMIHVKDLDIDGNITELGKGVVDFKSVIEFAENAHVEWLSYEQDTTMLPALESAEISIRYLNKIML